MPTTSVEPTTADPKIEPRIVLDRISYAQYEAINDAIVDRHDPRMVYAEGRLVLLSPSRLHDWYAGLIDYLIVAVATASGIEWEIAGQSTYRHAGRDAGVEGDRAYYFGANAERMRGPQNIDLSTQPPPDLVIEVEHTHPAHEAIVAWGRIGAPELWRFDVGRHQTSFWSRRDDGTYSPIDRSLGLPVLQPDDVDDQLRLAESLGTARWHARLGDWARDVLAPRLGELP